MIFFDYSPFTVKQLKLYAKNRRIRNKDYKDLRKSDLIHLLRRDQAVRIIQTFFLVHCFSRKWVNATDPLTQEQLLKPWFEIELVPDSGKYYRYNMLEFYDYMRTTGNYKDPYTDTHFSDNQLKIFDAQLRNNGFCKASLYTMKYNKRRNNALKKKIEEEEQLLAIERQIGELLTEVCDYLIRFSETADEDSNQTEPYYILVHDFFPNFCHLFMILSNLNLDYANQCLSHYISWVEQQNVPLSNVILLFLRKEHSELIT